MTTPAARTSWRFCRRCPAIFRRMPVLVLALLATLVAASKGQSPDHGQTATAQPDYGKLVRGLVSPNRPVEVYDENQVRYPPAYDFEAQRSIEKNRRLLYKHCAEALPFLIDGSTDSRYSLTWMSDSYAANSCVGEVCLGIVRAYLEVYREYLPPGSKKDYDAYSFVPRMHATIGKSVTEAKKKEVKEWWQRRKGKSLLELQIEAFDWAIAKWKQESHADKPIARLLAVRNKLVKDRQCLPPPSIPPSLVGPGS